MAQLKTGTTIGGQTAWHTGNDGTGSGLDADTLDGLHAGQLMPAQAATTLPAPRKVGDIGIDSDSVPISWDATWRTPSLLNSWTTYDAVWGPPRYRKVMSGLVVMEGLVKGGGNGTVIFTLPAGYRPQYHCMMATIGGANWGCRLQVSSDGSVIPTFGTGATNAFYSLCCWWYAVG